MSPKKRERAGLGLLIAIGLILLAVGIRYLSSTEWWRSIFNANQPTVRTINTGASVQVANSDTTNNDRTPSIDASPSPQPDDDSLKPDVAEPKRRMW